MSLGTRTINIQLREQNPRSRVVSFKPKLTGADGDVLLEKNYKATVNASGSGSINLPVKSTGSIRYDWEVEKEDGLSTGYFLLSAGSAVSFDALIAAGGEVTDVVLDYIDSQIEEHEAKADGTAHTISGVNGLQAALDAKASSSHTHSTSDVTEGSNLYFTAARVLATVLTGLSTATNAVITAGDSVLSALGKLQKQISDNLATLVSHTGNTSNPHGVTKAQVGLGSADDTSDLNKPVSNATQSALDTKITVGDDIADETSRLALTSLPKFYHVKQSDNSHGFILLDENRPEKIESWLDLSLANYSPVTVFAIDLDVSHEESEVELKMPSGWYIIRRASFFGASDGISSAQFDLNGESGGSVTILTGLAPTLSLVTRYSDIAISGSNNKMYNRPSLWIRTVVAESGTVNFLLEVQRVPGDYS